MLEHPWMFRVPCSMFHVQCSILKQPHNPRMSPARYECGFVCAGWVAVVCMFLVPFGRCRVSGSCFSELACGLVACLVAWLGLFWRPGPSGTSTAMCHVSPCVAAFGRVYVVCTSYNVVCTFCVRRVSVVCTSCVGHMYVVCTSCVRRV
jgi:hypothetical protein